MDAEGRQDAAPLVRALAQQLARFRVLRRGGRLHIGRDMDLCAYVAAPTGLARPCSPRCAQVAALLAEAAVYLGGTVEEFYAPAPRRRGKGAG